MTGAIVRATTEEGTNGWKEDLVCIEYICMDPSCVMVFSVEDGSSRSVAV